MVTRAFNTPQVREFNQELGRTRSTVQGTILPALGLGLAFNFLTGSMGANTAAGVAMGQATYGAQTAMQQLADTVAQFFLPGIENASEGAADLLEWFNDLDEDTQQLISNLALAGGGAYLLRGQILATSRLLLTPVGAGTVGALLAGGLVGAGVYDITQGTNPLGQQSTAARAQRRVFEGITGRNAPENNIRENFITNTFNIQTFDVETMISRLQDAFDQGLITVP